MSRKSYLKKLGMIWSIISHQSLSNLQNLFPQTTETQSAQSNTENLREALCLRDFVV
jgi:hypothetical protein